jgi:hypothetical protein
MSSAAHPVSTLYSHELHVVDLGQEPVAKSCKHTHIHITHHTHPQAADKTTSTVNKTATDVKKAVNKALSTTTKKDDEHKHLKEAAVAVPAVALIIAGVCFGGLVCGGLGVTWPSVTAADCNTARSTPHSHQSPTRMCFDSSLMCV